MCPLASPGWGLEARDSAQESPTPPSTGWGSGASFLGSISQEPEDSLVGYCPPGCFHVPLLGSWRAVTEGAPARVLVVVAVPTAEGGMPIL